MAAVVIVLMAVLAVVAWKGNHTLGHLAHDKTSLMRATDAAAYSAAVVQARALNLHAYLNRAQLAHQVAMAHLVTIASAERFRAMQARQSSAFNPPATVIAMLFGADHAAAYLAARAGGADAVALGQLEQAFERHDALVHNVIAGARDQQMRDLMPMRDHAIRQVLVRNVGASGSDLKASSLEKLGLAVEFGLDDWPGRVQQFGGDSPAWQRLLFAVSRQHGYLNERHSNRRNLWAVSARCPHKRHELRRRGKTSLDQQGHWRSTDTLSFHALRSNQTIGCYEREYPMGWAILRADGFSPGSATKRLPGSGTRGSQSVQTSGGAPVVENALVSLSNHDEPPQRFSDQAFWRWVGQQASPGWDIFNGSDNRLATRWGQGSVIQWVTRGRPAHVDLAPDHRAPLRIVLNVHQAAAGRQPFRPDGQRVIAVNQSGITANRDNSLHSTAAAQAYFARRHRRADGRHEKPNLFHPYWHARLIPVPDHLSASIAEQGGRR
jgi:hypothetical protein